MVGQNCEPDLDFTKATKLFKLAMGVQTDLSQLPPVLEKLSDFPSFNFNRLFDFDHLEYLLGVSSNFELFQYFFRHPCSLDPLHRSIPIP